MFDTIRPTTCTISNIDLGSYLMLRGARLEGTSVISKNRGAFTFSHKRLSDLIHDFHQDREIRFSPKALFRFRDDLKRLVVYPERSAA